MRYLQVDSHGWRALVGALLFAIVMSVGVAQPAWATCSGNVARTTPSTKAVLAGVYTYWATQTDTAGAPCEDVNILNNDWDLQAFLGAYKSGAAWYTGSAGWVDIDEAYLGVVISGLLGTGIPVTAASYEASWAIRILT